VGKGTTFTVTIPKKAKSQENERLQIEVPGVLLTTSTFNRYR
jgi:hypothetical protein